MFDSYSKNAMNVYSKLSTEANVLAECPHQLIMSLFDSAISAISDAIREMEAGHSSLRGNLITYAVLIIETGLRASLNKKNGGELALNLDIFYAFLAKELVIAKNTNDEKKLDAIKKLLLKLRIAWLQVRNVKAVERRYLDDVKKTGIDFA